MPSSSEPRVKRKERTSTGSICSCKQASTIYQHHSFALRRRDHDEEMVLTSLETSK